MSFHQVSQGAPGSALATLRVWSISHRTCGLPALGGVIAHGDAARLQGLLAAAGVDAIVLSTCNRFEVYWRVTGDHHDQEVDGLIEAALPQTKPLLHGGAVRHAGDDAARHLFRVCCGLESMVLGEAEILGQVRTAVDQSPAAGAFLRGVFTAAIRTGRGARAETGIANGAMSVASAALQQLDKTIAIGSSRIVIVGAGETAAKLARQLAAIGVGALVIANRTPERAAALAGQYGGEAVGLESLAAEVGRADAVICAAFSSNWMVTRAHIGDRAARALTLVDLAMPPGIEPFTAPGITRIDLAAIERATADHRQRRESEIPRVDAFIDREIEWLQTWARRELLRPFVSTLRQKADLIRRDELARARAELRDGDPNLVLERFSRRVFDRLLSVPLEPLKSGDLPFDGASADYLRRLFALDQGPVPALSGSTSEGES